MKATVTSKGQVTIPYLIRCQAKITTGSQLDFQLESDGSIVIHPLSRDVSQLKGIVKSKRKRSVSLKEMKNAVQAHAKDRMK